MRLTEATIKKLSKPKLYSDDRSRGLYLNVAKSGSKSWIQRIVIGGKRRDIGLGPWPLISIDEAREDSFEIRRDVRKGRNPLDEKRKAKKPTFRQAMEATISNNKGDWKNGKTEKNWRQRLEKYALKKIGDIQIDMIGRDDMIRLLKPVIKESPQTGRKVRQYIRAVFAWATAEGYRDDDPADERISAALPKVSASKNFRALPYAEIPEALDIIEASKASPASKLAFRFVVLSALRSGEVRNATWSMVDMKIKALKIPAEKMKQAKEHRVPLSDELLEILESAKALNDGSDLIFPSPMRKGKALSDMALTKLLRDNGLAERATIHGMRSAFRDWCGESGVDREVAEAALAHSVNGVEGDYFRSDLFERRREVMQSWADYLVKI